MLYYYNKIVTTFDCLKASLPQVCQGVKKPNQLPMYLNLSNCETT